MVILVMPSPAMPLSLPVASWKVGCAEDEAIVSARLAVAETLPATSTAMAVTVCIPLVKAAADLDRGVSAPHFTADGRAIDALVADDRSAYPARIPLAGGAAQKLMQAPIVLSGEHSAQGCSVAIVGSDTRPNEIFAIEDGSEVAGP